MCGWPGSGPMQRQQPGLVQSISSGLSIICNLRIMYGKGAHNAGLAFRENERVHVFFTCRSVCAI